MTITTNVKPGWKTTEFWLTLAGNILGGLNMVGAMPGIPDNVKGTAAVAGGVLSAVATAGYAISRAIAKKDARTVTTTAGISGGPTVNP